MTSDETSPSYTETDKIAAKFRHMLLVPELMLELAESEHFAEREKTIAYAVAQFHDFICLKQIVDSGTYAGDHALKSFEAMVKVVPHDLFSEEEWKTIGIAINAHNKAACEKTGIPFCDQLVDLIRDADKIDCLRRMTEESYGLWMQKEPIFNGTIRPNFLEKAKNGEPIKYAEMTNACEEIALYLGWALQLKTDSGKALLKEKGYATALAKRIKSECEKCGNLTAEQQLDMLLQTIEQS